MPGDLPIPIQVIELKGNWKKVGEGKDGSSCSSSSKVHLGGVKGLKGSTGGLGPLMGHGKSGVSLWGGGHKLTAKFVHSAVEGLGFLGSQVSLPPLHHPQVENEPGL